MRLSFRRTSRSSKLFFKIPVLVVSAIALALTGNAMTVAPASAALAGMGRAALPDQVKEDGPLIQVRRGGGGGGRHMGGGGGGRHMGGGGGRHYAGGGRPGMGRPGGRPGGGRAGVGRPGVGRPGVVAGGRGRWVRPARYTWRPGGAIAAGAAIGFVTAAAAASWAGAPPVAG